MEVLTEYFKIDSTYTLISQIIGFCALAVSMTSFQMKTQKKIVTLQIFSCALFSLHFYMLGAITGAVLNIIACIRAIVFANRDKKWCNLKIMIPLFSVICVGAVIILQPSVDSVFPVLGMICTTLSWAVERPFLVRIISLPSSPLWIIYNALHKSYAGIITETFVMISIILGIIRLDLPKKGQKNGAGGGD